MKQFNPDTITRENIRQLVPYSSARDEFKSAARVFLDANENSLGSAIIESGFNRYPDPQQKSLKGAIAELKQVNEENIFIGNGSDEPIDLLVRAFCEPGLNNMIICPPTYGMYEVVAGINNIPIIRVPLLPGFELDAEGVLAAVNADSRIIFICSPNNPSANLMKAEAIEKLLTGFNGLVVVDEAYIDFAADASWLRRLETFPNLVVLQTLSKAWGLAALRVGMAFASTAIIGILNRIKPPYNLSEAAQQLALQALAEKSRVDEWIAILLRQREWLAQELAKLSCVEIVYPSNANFLLVKTTNAKEIYQYLTGKGIVVRNRSSVPGCENCLRITVGSPAENQQIIQSLQSFPS